MDRQHADGSAGHAGTETARRTARPSPLPAGKHDDKPLEGEIGGRDGPEPTRFGDWEKNGRCIDF